MTTLADIGTMLHTARARKGLAKTTLAALSNVHRNTVQQLENGSANVELNTLIGLCDALGLSIVLVPNEVAEQVAPDGGTRESAMARLLDQRLGNQGPTK
jgi:transcriptional regulator with XRE-family HTH domain